MTPNTWILARAAAFHGMHKSETEATAGWPHEAHGPTMAYLDESPEAYRKAFSVEPPADLITRIVAAQVSE